MDLDDDMTMYKIPEDNVDESYVRFSLDMTDHTYYYVRSSEIGDSRPRAWPHVTPSPFLSIFGFSNDNELWSLFTESKVK